MSDVQYITVKPLSGISPEQARDAQARAWAFVFDCWQRKAAGTNTSKGGSKCSHVTKGDQCDLEK
jgi:hypothetical protein